MEREDTDLLDKTEYHYRVSVCACRGRERYVSKFHFLFTTFLHILQRPSEPAVSFDQPELCIVCSLLCSHQFQLLLQSRPRPLKNPSSTTGLPWSFCLRRCHGLLSPLPKAGNQEGLCNLLTLGFPSPSNKPFPKTKA